MYIILDSSKNYKPLSFFMDDNNLSNYLMKNTLKQNEILVQEVSGMKIISRIVKVDGEVVYNSPKFWSSEEATNILKQYDGHEVLDILGKKIDYQRYCNEFCSIQNKIRQIDGRPGQISYNMQVGQEFVSLFREECILTKFTKESNTSPMIIFSKLATVISMLSAGAFREARQWLQSYRNTIKDDFLTDERIDKYIAMLSSADAIEYATEEDYFYVVPERTEANEFLEE